MRMLRSIIMFLFGLKKKKKRKNDSSIYPMY
jgi:hypothetical protein